MKHGSTSLQSAVDPEAHCGQGLGQQRDYYYGCLNRPPLKSAIPTAHTNESHKKKGLRGREEGRGFCAPTLNEVADHLWHKEPTTSTALPITSRKLWQSG